MFAVAQVELNPSKLASQAYVKTILSLHSLIVHDSWQAGRTIMPSNHKLNVSVRPHRLKKKVLVRDELQSSRSSRS